MLCEADLSSMSVVQLEGHTVCSIDYMYMLIGWTFVWKCRRDCETMPVYDEDFNEVTPMTTLCNHYNKTYVLLEDGSEDRGCFINDGYLNSGKNTQLISQIEHDPLFCNGKCSTG